MAVLRSLGTTLEMIKWEHSVLTLPFGLTGAVLAARGIPSGRQLLWIAVGLVAARSAAMSFNRLADQTFDAANPRTRMRALPAGTLSRKFVAVFVAASSLLLVLAAAQLNRLAFYLSPVALAIVLLYSYTKRFTRWSHLVLGFAMGLAPAAGWVAVRGWIDPRILILTAAVTFWGGGFDVLYACQDYEFDCQSGLYSVPRFFGIARALWIARVFHLMTLALLATLAYAFSLGPIAIAGIVVVGLLLAYEHSLVSVHDLSRLNAAFFTMNGVISMVFLGFVTANFLVRR
ncbi:MAG: UbiA-like polyprenyltransferase [Terriglobales bacterium]